MWHPVGGRRGATIPHPIHPSSDSSEDSQMTRGRDLFADPGPSRIVVLPPGVKVTVLAAFPQLSTAKPPEAEDVSVGPPIGPASRRRLLDHILVLVHPLLQFPGPAFFRVKARHVEHGFPRSSGKGRSRLSVSEPPQKESECATRMSSPSRPNDKSNRVDPNP